MSRLTPLAIAALLTACPSSGPDAGKADAKKADAKKVDAKTTDAKKADAKNAGETKLDAKADTKVEPTPDPTPEALAPEVEQAVATSINAFAIDLHHELGATPGNLFVSPASIAIAFAMTRAGAKGETASQLDTAFHVPASIDLNPGFAATLARWDAASGGLELDVANRLFGEKTVKFEPGYLAVTKDVFAAPLEPLDFVGAADPSRRHINDWVAAQTHDKILDLLPTGGVTDATRLVLVNAIYFKAKWAEPFEQGNTADGPFIGDEKTTAKLMHRVDYYKLGVAKDAKLRTLELPYEGSEYAMVIVLPDDANGLGAVEQALSADALKGWLDGATAQRVDLKLPRFRIEPGAALELRAPLEKLGVVTAWDAGKADFTGMAPASEKLTISEAYHKAFVAVDEAGTEAAAATAVSMKAGSAAPTDEPVPFVVDHPFLFLVRDMKTGAILFMGRLVDP
jgi:serpin B